MQQQRGGLNMSKHIILKLMELEPSLKYLWPSPIRFAIFLQWEKKVMIYGNLVRPINLKCTRSSHVTNPFSCAIPLFRGCCIQFFITCFGIMTQKKLSTLKHFLCDFKLATLLREESSVFTARRKVALCWFCRNSHGSLFNPSSPVKTLQLEKSRGWGVFL